MSDNQKEVEEEEKVKQQFLDSALNQLQETRELIQKQISLAKNVSKKHLLETRNSLKKNLKSKCELFQAFDDFDDADYLNKFEPSYIETQRIIVNAIETINNRLDEINKNEDKARQEHALRLAKKTRGKDGKHDVPLYLTHQKGHLAALRAIQKGEGRKKTKKRRRRRRRRRRRKSRKIKRQRNKRKK